MKPLWKKILLVLIFIFVFIFSVNVFANPNPENSTENIESIDPISASMPSLEKVYDKKYNDNIYITDYKENYSIDANLGMLEVVDKTLNKITNILFTLQRAMVQSLIFLFDKALTFSSYDIFDNILENFIKGMYKSAWGIISGILLSCLGLYFFVKMIQQRQVEFWTGLTKTVVIIAIATLYFTNPLFLASRVETASNEITKMVVSAGNKEDIHYYPEPLDNVKKKETITIIANNLWDEYVHKPWRIMEFGNNKIADKWENDILKLPEGSDERKDKIIEIEENAKVETESMITKRLGFMLMYLIPLTVNILLMAILCIAIIGLQFFVMLLFVLGVFVFIVALIPNFGMEAVKKWGFNIIVLSGMKIMLAFVLMVMLAFNNALYETAQQDGWIYVLILQLAIYITMYVFRAKIFNIFTLAKEIAVNPKKALDRIKQHGELSPFSNYGPKMPMRTPKMPRIKVEDKSTGTVTQKVRKGVKDYMGYVKENQNKVKDRLDDNIENEKANKYLDKKYNFKKQKVGKMNPTKYHKDMDYVDRVDGRKKSGEELYTADEIKQVKERRKKAKEYIEKREIRANRNRQKGSKEYNKRNKENDNPRYVPGGRIMFKKWMRRNGDEKK